jgi:uncharacterized protein YyaL (SSP411 family)
VLLVSVYHLLLTPSPEEFDEQYGGFGGAPKFPPSMHIMMLLRIFRRTGEKEVLRMAEVRP